MEKPNNCKTLFSRKKQQSKQLHQTECIISLFLAKAAQCNFRHLLEVK